MFANVLTRYDKPTNKTQQKVVVQSRFASKHFKIKMLHGLNGN